MEKKHEWKAAHGFRKFYKTHAEQVMKPINVETTMGYNIGVSASYYRPTEREVLEDYLKAIPPLTVNSSELLLQDQLKELTEKTKNDEYLIKGKLAESYAIFNEIFKTIDANKPHRINTWYVRILT